MTQQLTSDTPTRPTELIADVIHNVVALRAEPNGRSEQVSQAVMGEPVVVVDQSQGYARVRTADSYEAWVLSEQIRVCKDGEPFARPSRTGLSKVWTPFATLTAEDGTPGTRLPFGSVLEVLTEGHCDDGPRHVRLPDESTGYISEPALVEFSWSIPVFHLPGLARGFLGTPYLWGGTTPFGFDCSGFVQRLYSAAGKIIPRDAYQQAASPLGARVPEGEPLQAGDLVLFLGAADPRNRGITHVGMMIDDHRMIHAYGKAGVIIHPLDCDEIRATYTYRGAWRCGGYN